MHHPSCPTTGYSCFISRFWIIKLLKLLGTWADPIGVKRFAFFPRLHMFQRLYCHSEKCTGSFDRTSHGKSDSSSRQFFKESFSGCLWPGWPWVDCFVFVSRTGSGTPHYRHAARLCFWSSRAVTSYPAYLDISCLPFSLLLTFPSFPILWKQHRDKK